MKRKIKKNKKKILLIASFIVSLILIILLVRLCLTNSNNTSLAYGKNGKIYAYINGKSHSLGESELSTVKIKNEKNPQFLYKIEDQLYLFKNKKQIKLLKNVKQYAFYDELIVMLTKEDDLYIYKDKATKIVDKIDEVIGSNSDYLVYGKEKVLYKVDKSNLKITKITDFYNNAIISENKEKIIYLSKEDQIMISNFKKSEKQSETDKVLRYSCDSSCENYYYLTYDTKTLYYVNRKGKKTEIAKDVLDINQTAPKQEVIVYTKQAKDALATYINISGKEITLPKDTGLSDLQIDERYIYYSTNTGDSYAISLKNKKPVKIATQNSERFIKSNNDYYLTISKDAHKNIYRLVKEKKEKIASDIISGSVKGKEDSNLLCYQKQEDSKTLLLCKKNGKKEKEIDDNIRNYEIDKNNVYYLKDYDVSKKAGDLYVYNNHSKKILERINDYLLPQEEQK